MPQDGVFKKTMFGGFDRKSVLKYLDSIIVKHAEKVNELQSHCTELFNKNAEISEALLVINDEKHELMDRLSGEEREKKQLAETIARLREENEALKATQQDIEAERAAHHAELTALKDETSALRAQVEALKAEAEKLRAASAEGVAPEMAINPAQNADEMYASIGRALVEATASAENIVAKAQQKADRIKETLESRVQQISGEIPVFKNELMAMRDELREILDILDKRINSIDSSVEQMVNAVSVFDSQLFDDSDLPFTKKSTAEPNETPAEPKPEPPAEPGEAIESETKKTGMYQILDELLKKMDMEESGYDEPKQSESSGETQQPPVQTVSDIPDKPAPLPVSNFGPIQQPVQKVKPIERTQAGPLTYGRADDGENPKKHSAFFLW